jgi:hypothetical protein
LHPRIITFSKLKEKNTRPISEFYRKHITAEISLETEIRCRVCERRQEKLGGMAFRNVDIFGFTCEQGPCEWRSGKSNALKIRK